MKDCALKLLNVKTKLLQLTDVGKYFFLYFGLLNVPFLLILVFSIISRANERKRTEAAARQASRPIADPFADPGLVFFQNIFSPFCLLFCHYFYYFVIIYFVVFVCFCFFFVDNTHHLVPKV